MLRSRGNRQQRPSESTDEQQGRTGYYGGYPSSSSSGGAGGGGVGVGIASGADDYYGYNNNNNNNTNNANNQSKGRGRFGYGSGNKKTSASSGAGGGSSFSNRNVWDKRSMGSTIKGNPNSSSGSSAGSLLLSVVVILTLAMGGATLHYKRLISRMEHELEVVQKRQSYGRFNVPNDADDDDDNGTDHKEHPSSRGQGFNKKRTDYTSTTTSTTPEEMNALRQKRSELEIESTKLTATFKSLEREVNTFEAQMKSLSTNELPSYEKQIAEMQKNLQNSDRAAQQYKAQFKAAHYNKSGESSGIIVPGGPGHALNQRKEIDSMESLDDYEDYVQRREDALWDKVDLLVGRLGKESRREAEQWFGPAPHMVELEISYPKVSDELEPSEWPRVRGVFTMEMAPLSLMPIAANLFLQQIHHKLWNGCSFVINAMHILQAGPHRYNTEDGRYDANLPELVERFKNSRLDKMPFQEYHEDYPHAKYTVGFAGRPGGPDFYINKIDNSVNHGPGGQSHHDLHEEADPCFAKIVGGVELLEELNKIPTDYDKGALLLYSVEIIDSRVISSKDRRQEQEEKQVDQQQQPNDNGSENGESSDGTEMGKDDQTNEKQPQI